MSTGEPPTASDFANATSDAMRVAWQSRGVRVEVDGDGPDFFAIDGDASVHIVFDIAEGRPDATFLVRGERVRAFEIVRAITHPFDEDVAIDAMSDAGPEKATRLVALFDEPLRRWAQGDFASLDAILSSRAASREKPSLALGAPTRFDLPLQAAALVPPTVALFLDALAPVLVDGWRAVSFSTSRSGYAMAVEHERGLGLATRFFVTTQDHVALVAFDARAGLVDVGDPRAVPAEKILAAAAIALPTGFFTYYGFRRLRAYAERLAELESLLGGDIALLGGRS